MISNILSAGIQQIVIYLNLNDTEEFNNILLVDTPDAILQSKYTNKYFIHRPAIDIGTG